MTWKPETPRRPLEERFWEKVDKSGECWVWTGAMQKNGYGVISLRAGKTARAHRISLELQGQKIPAGMFVCHHCDNRKCVRPDHLFIGSVKDNTVDMMDKGRVDHFKHLGPKREQRARGVRVWNTTLTEEQVSEIRKLHREGTQNYILAEMFGVHRATISGIVNNKVWRHVK